MRGGVTFGHVEHQLDYLVGLGVSHIYLSPIFAASEGSTHGYDILDPTRIEPSLGGREDFEKLARAAHAVGLGIILDIVPNHTAFTPENEWLKDVLRHGPQSPFASFFDIDWSSGPLVLPWLPEPFKVMQSRGDFSVRNGNLCFAETEIPLAMKGGEADRVEDPSILHDRQHWRLRHWELERDGITHRRFFNVTSLIGMRVEETAVFEATHRLIIDLVHAGLVDGLRVDHIDGLADPKSYLDRLAEYLPETPVWVEKILVGDEKLDRRWKTVGTTGYEASSLIAHLLTDANGIETLTPLWRRYTGVEEEFSTALEAAKLEILHNELSAELHQLSTIAGACLADDPGVEPGPEGLREGVTQLLLSQPRYRTYLNDASASGEDRALVEQIVERAKGRVRSSRIVERLAHHLIEPANHADRRFATRLQQVSGALLAKAQEDTAGFRWTRYLAANEVGAEPEQPTVSDDEANAFLAERRSSEMTLTSSHDTKRSEDSRMRVVAISHYPDAFHSLVADADRLAPDALPRRWRWYIVQSVLALWGVEPQALKLRLRQHNQKALREAKLESYWTKPNATMEGAADSFSDILCDHWQKGEPTALRKLVEAGQALSLAQLALKCLLPGFPDIYRGAEAPFFALTDPDNRLPVDWSTMLNLADSQGFGGDKVRLTRLLLALRRDQASFFSTAVAAVDQDSGTILRRTGEGRTLAVTLGRAVAGTPIWQSGSGDLRLVIAWR